MGIGNWLITQAMAKGQAYQDLGLDSQEKVHKKVKEGFQLLKLISNALIIVSIVACIFSLFSCPFGWRLFVFTLIHIFHIVFWYDMVTACSEGVSMMETNDLARDKLTFLYTKDRSEFVQNARDTWMPMFKETVLLGSFVDYAFFTQLLKAAEKKPLSKVSEGS